MVKESYILNSLYENFADIKRINQSLKEDFKVDSKSLEATGSLKEKENKLLEVEVHVKHLINAFYKTSEKIDFYYFDCQSKIYINHFEKRKRKYFLDNIDAVERDFLLSEINYFNNPQKNRYFVQDDFIKLPYEKYIEYSDRYRISLNKKLTFLEGELVNYNLGLKIKEHTDIFDDKGNVIGFGTVASVFEVLEEIEKLDANNKNQLTTNQIVLLLQEIGFFTHPKIEDASKVKQAKLISLITRVHEKTIKTNIEKLDKSPTKNGVNYQKDIDKINKILDDLI
jgi:hypothetical protein